MVGAMPAVQGAKTSFMVLRVVYSIAGGGMSTCWEDDGLKGGNGRTGSGSREEDVGSAELAFSTDGMDLGCCSVTSCLP